MVKIDLGCHIDGYISVAAHTLIVPQNDKDKVTESDDEMGNVAVAAYNAMLVAVSTIKSGGKNEDVATAVERVAKHYGVSPISSVCMHQMKRFVIDGVKEVALHSPTPDELKEFGEDKVPACEFEQAEVYVIDVAMSTCDGRAKHGETI